MPTLLANRQEFNENVLNTSFNNMMNAIAAGAMPA
jgi:hypothetical protein